MIVVLVAIARRAVAGADIDDVQFGIEGHLQSQHDLAGHGPRGCQRLRHQIRRLLDNGRSLAEVSVALSFGYKTVANAVSFKQKLDVPTPAALIRLAVELGFKER
jgi:hypothetical protein